MFKEILKRYLIINFFFLKLQVFDDNSSDIQRQHELDKIETHSFFESTTIQSKDDEDSDYDELSESIYPLLSLS
jgi:hypothetical protein